MSQDQNMEQNVFPSGCDLHTTFLSLFPRLSVQIWKYAEAHVNMIQCSSDTFKFV